MRNDPEGATVEIEGARAAVSRFFAKVESGLPPLARIDSTTVELMKAPDRWLRVKVF